MRYPDIQRRSIFLLKMLGVAALYALLIHMDHHYFESGNTVSSFEAASGFALAVLLIGGRQYVWGVFLGATLMHTMTVTFWESAAISTGDALEAFCGAWLLTRDSKFDLAIRSLRDYLRLILLGGIVSIGIGASVGVALLFVSGFVTPGNFFHELAHWWVGDMLGVILVAPLILVCRYTKNDGLGAKRVVESAVLLGLTFLAGQIVFLGWFTPNGMVEVMAKGYWMFLFVALVAFRLGVRGTVIAINMTAVQALMGAYHGTGFFADDIAQPHLASYWSYIVNLSVIGMALATYFAEHKQAEADLRASSDSLKEAQRIAQIGNWHLDLTSGELTWSDEIFHLFEIDPGQFAATYEAFLSAIHPADRDAVRRAYTESLAQRTPYDITHRLLMGDGRVKWVHEKCITDFDAAGKPLRSMGTVQDITERRNNEIIIERLNRTYRLLSMVNEAIVRARGRSELFAAICDAAAGSGLFRFAWVGVLDENWVIPVIHAGVEEGYLSSKFDILLDDERTGNGPTGRAILLGAHVVCQDIEHDPCMAPWRNEALGRGYHSSAAFPILEAGRIVGAINVYAGEAHFFTPDIIEVMLELAADVSFALDTIAERKRRELAEDEIRRINAELESRVAERATQLLAANKELETFSYSVSHDLRAPLRGIDGFSRTLLKKYHGQLDATGQDWLERICRASQHMGHLIDDILNLSQVTRSPLKLEPVDLSKIAENIADNLGKTNPERQVRFILQQGLSVQADHGLLHVVMDNLLSNAFKFTGKKADAEIEFGACGIDGKRAFFVRDNGDGFNMEYAHKLFGAFQRLHTANEFEGTGIGLATVQRVIHRHNGKVWAEAIEGQGATFYFTLPQMEQADSNGGRNQI